MHISFWSPVHGQCGVTSNLSILAMTLSVKHGLKGLMIQNQLKYHSLDELFLEPYERDMDLNGLETGIDALIRYIKFNALDQESLDNYTTNIIQGKLDLIRKTQMNQSSSFKQGLIEIYEALVYGGLKYYDLIFSDVTGDYFENEEILGLSDIVVVNLNQNKSVLEAFFQSIEYQQIKDKCFFLLGRYQDLSKYSDKNLVRKYGFNSKSQFNRLIGQSDYIGVIPEYTPFFDAMNDGKLLEFFYLERTEEKNNQLSSFYKRIIDTSDKLYRVLENKNQGIKKVSAYE